MQTPIEQGPAQVALQQLRLSGALIEQLSDAVMAIDKGGSIIECNEVARDLFGIDESLSHLSLFCARYEIWREGANIPSSPGEGPLCAALDGDDKPPELFHLIEREGDRSIWIRGRSMSLRDSDGNVVGAVSISSDVTEELRSRQAAMDSDAQYGAILRAIPDHLLKLDRNGTILAFKPGPGTPYPIKPSRFIGRKYTEIFPPHLVEASKVALERAFASQTASQFEFELNDAGLTLYFEARLAPVNQKELIAIVRDISERRNRERDREAIREELAALTHLANVNEMASTMAHELNQPLSAIGLYARGCQRRLASDAEDVEGMQQALSQVVEQAQRAGEIIRSIREYSQNGIGGFENCDIHPIVERVAHIASFDAQERGVEIQLALGAESTMALMDRAQMQTALLQLVRNAIEASSRAGREHQVIQIATSNDPEQKTLELRVRDRGPGIRDEERDRIFELFFTTKSNGVGLGLPIARSIAVAHGGRLVLDSNTADGAVFCLRLPTAKEGEVRARHA